MKSRTLCFAPGRIVPGMVLARAIADHEGNTLLTIGTVMSLELIDRLIRRGVEAVHVLVADRRSEVAIADELQAATARIDTIFRLPGSASRDDLRAAVLAFREESIQ